MAGGEGNRRNVKVDKEIKTRKEAVKAQCRRNEVLTSS